VLYTTSHTGVVRGGTALSIVPDACTFEFEFRPLATDDVGSLVDEVMAHAREQLEPEMRAVDPAARRLLSILQWATYRRPFHQYETLPLIR
jgi:hypothetical protein